MSRRQGKKSVATWLVTLALVFAQSGLPSFLVQAQGSAPPDQSDVEKTVEQLERLFAALEAAAREIPRDTFDPEAILDEVDLEAESLFFWVRDNTYLVPYQGALRGPVGVLMDRLGNSLDRALLLSELLQLLGYDTRLARAQLSLEQAQDIFLRTRPMPAEGLLTHTTTSDVSVEEYIERFAAEFSLKPAFLQEVLAQNQQQGEILEAQMVQRVEEQASSIYVLLEEPTGNVEAERAAQLEALQNHWWVQYQEGGMWIDLDPTLPDASPGITLSAAVETLPITSIAEVPETLLQAVQIRVVLECAEAGTLVEHVLLESPRLLPAALLGQRISLEHVPVSWPQTLGPMDDAALKALVLEQDRWFPVLTVGEQSAFDRDFTAACELGMASPPGLGGVGSTLNEAANVFDDLFAEPEAGDGATVTAQWLEYIISVPGVPDEIARRQIFDLVGPSRRALATASPALTEAEQLGWRLALLGGTELLLLGGQVSPEYVGLVIAERMLANREALREVAREPTDLARAYEISKSIQPITGELYGLALARRTWQALAGPVYLAQPNLLSYHRQLRITAQGEVSQLKAFDIIANDVAVDIRTGTSPFEARLKQGVLDTNAEALLAAVVCHEATSDTLCTSNTAEAFQMSLGHDLPWRVARKASDLTGLPWPEDALSRVRQDLADGYLVLLPEQPVLGNVPWWRIDAQRGETLGVDEQGWGAAPEYGALINFIGVGGGFAFCYLGAVLGATPGASMTLCMLGAAAGAVPAAGITGVTGVIFAMAAVLLSGMGGLGVPIR